MTARKSLSIIIVISVGVPMAMAGGELYYRLQYCDYR
jgi:hypothetical protein